MSEVKQHRSYDEQINILLGKGCVIANTNDCKDILKNVGYYRLSAYFLPFKKEDGSYEDGLTLNAFITFMNLTESLETYFLLPLRLSKSVLEQGCRIGILKNMARLDT